MLFGSPSICMRTTKQSLSATRCAILGSPKAVTSLTMRAPASRATSALEARAGGLAADVYHLRSFVEQRLGLSHRPVEIKELPTVGEGVGGDIENPHENGVGA